MEELTESLQNLGYTAYEAAVYLALLQAHPATGYELSKKSRVPQAKIYETLPRLVDKGLIFSLGGEPAKYAPLPVRHLLAKLKLTFEENLSRLEKQLAAYSHRPPVAYMQNLVGAKQILERVKATLSLAQARVLLQAPGQVTENLKPLIRKLLQRHIQVSVCSVDGLTNPAYPFLLLVDNQVIMGQPPLAEDSIAVYSDNDALVELAHSYLKQSTGVEPPIAQAQELTNQVAHPVQPPDLFAPAVLEKILAH